MLHIPLMVPVALPTAILPATQIAQHTLADVVHNMGTVETLLRTAALVAFLAVHHPLPQLHVQMDVVVRASAALHVIQMAHLVVAVLNMDTADLPLPTAWCPTDA